MAAIITTLTKRITPMAAVRVSPKVSVNVDNACETPALSAFALLCCSLELMAYPKLILSARRESNFSDLRFLCAMETPLPFCFFDATPCFQDSPGVSSGRLALGVISVTGEAHEDNHDSRASQPDWRTGARSLPPRGNPDNRRWPRSGAHNAPDRAAQDALFRPAQAFRNVQAAGCERQDRPGRR